jgi:hypothetical protein
VELVYAQWLYAFMLAMKNPWPSDGKDARKAIRLFRKTVRELKALNETDTPYYAAAKGALADHHLFQEEYSLAASEFNEALEIMDAIYETDYLGREQYALGLKKALERLEK